MGRQSEERIQDERDSLNRAKRFYDKQVKDRLTPEMQEFIRRQPMMFVATADTSGACDCSPRFGAPGFVRMVDPKTLAYPEFRGNGVFASLGNIAENPAIGLLFVDFLKTSVGLHVNGKAERRDPDDGPVTLDLVTQNYGTSGGRLVEQWVFVTIEEAYIHCSKHVPRFQPVPRNISWGTDDATLKSDQYFLTPKSK
jgi:predicted pyridoxine 5'-phosphate oxidase superfamily flavin-nucleotide-binding protein